MTDICTEYASPELKFVHAIKSINAPSHVSPQAVEVNGSQVCTLWCEKCIQLCQSVTVRPNALSLSIRVLDIILQTYEALSRRLSANALSNRLWFPSASRLLGRRPPRVGTRPASPSSYRTPSAPGDCRPSDAIARHCSSGSRI